MLAELALFSVDGFRDGPQARSRKDPERPQEDDLSPFIHSWFGTATAAIEDVYQDRHGYMLTRSNFTPHESVRALAASRASDIGTPIHYRGMRTRRGGEYTEFRYFLTPNIAMGSFDWRGHTIMHRYHNALLRDPEGIPVSVRTFYAPSDERHDPMFGWNESVQWENALLTRGELRIGGTPEESEHEGWRVIHTPAAALAVWSLEDEWKLLVALDRRIHTGDLRDVINSLSVPTMLDNNSIGWTSTNGTHIRFQRRMSSPVHRLFIDGVRQVRPNGMMHDSPLLKSWYATGVIDVMPESGPRLRLSTSSLDEVIVGESLEKNPFLQSESLETSGGR